MPAVPDLEESRCSVALRIPICLRKSSPVLQWEVLLPGKDCGRPPQPIGEEASATLANGRANGLFLQATQDTMPSGERESQAEGWGCGPQPCYMGGRRPGVPARSF